MSVLLSILLLLFYVIREGWRCCCLLVIGIGQGWERHGGATLCHTIHFIYRAGKFSVYYILNGCIASVASRSRGVALRVPGPQPISGSADLAGGMDPRHKDSIHMWGCVLSATGRGTRSAGVALRRACLRVYARTYTGAAPKINFMYIAMLHIPTCVCVCVM